MASLTVAHMIELSVKPLEMVASKSPEGYTLCYRYEETNKDENDVDLFSIAYNRRGQPKVYKSFDAIWADVQKINPGVSLRVVECIGSTDDE